MGNLGLCTEPQDGDVVPGAKKNVAAQAIPSEVEFNGLDEEMRAHKLSNLVMFYVLKLPLTENVTF